MPRIKCIIILSAIVAAAVAQAPGIPGAAANAPRDSGSARTPRSDQVAAERPSASEGAPLDRFSLAGVHRHANQDGCAQDKFRSGGAPIQRCRDRCRRVGLLGLARWGGRSSSATTLTCAIHSGDRHRKAGSKIANTRPCSEACSGSGHGSRVNRPAATPVNRAPTAAYSHTDKSVIPVSPPATSGGAVGRAALLRSLAQRERQRIAALSAYRKGQLATALDVAATAANKASAPQAVGRTHKPQSGFDWGDAGIGAAGGIALSMIGLGGALALSQNRARRTRHTTVLPS